VKLYHAPDVLPNKPHVFNAKSRAFNVSRSFKSCLDARRSNNRIRPRNGYKVFATTFFFSRSIYRISL